MAESLVEFDQDNPDHWVSLGLSHVISDEIETATNLFLRAVGLAPTSVPAHFGLGECLLTMGEFAPGWKEYEWRTITEPGRKSLPNMRSPIWNGMRLNGKVLFVADEGYGDAIQFCRFLPTVEDRCEVIFGCSPELLPLMQTLKGTRQTIKAWADVPPHAAHCRLSSLGHILNITPEKIPTKPYLHADPARVAEWQNRLPKHAIGITWSGRQTGLDCQKRRDIPPQLLQPLLQNDRPFVALQSNDVGLPIQDISGELVDWAETAAVIACLDLVITVDTAVAHLAGAMGCPVWVMLPRPCDWRWLRGRSDSIWYPTARLFRQKTPGNWHDVIDQVGLALLSA